MLKIGLGQFAPKILDCEFNLKHIQRILEQAEEESIDVLVLPELANSGYAFQSAEEMKTCSEEIPTGIYSKSLLKWSKENRLVVSGICEVQKNRYYNSAIVCANGEYLATYRKLHLFNKEKEFFLPGQEEPPVIEFKGYKFGIMVCWDWARSSPWPSRPWSPA